MIILIMLMIKINKKSMGKRRLPEPLQPPVHRDARLHAPGAETDDNKNVNNNNNHHHHHHHHTNNNNSIMNNDIYNDNNNKDHHSINNDNTHRSNNDINRIFTSYIYIYIYNIYIYIYLYLFIDQCIAIVMSGAAPRRTTTSRATAPC